QRWRFGEAAVGLPRSVSLLHHRRALNGRPISIGGMWLVIHLVRRSAVDRLHRRGRWKRCGRTRCGSRRRGGATLLLRTRLNRLRTADTRKRRARFFAIGRKDLWARWRHLPEPHLHLAHLAADRHARSGTWRTS